MSPPHGLRKCVSVLCICVFQVWCLLISLEIVFAFCASITGEDASGACCEIKFEAGNAQALMCSLAARRSEEVAVFV